MTKNPKPPPDDPKQSARFVETAKKLDVESGGKAFARVFKKIVPKKIMAVRGRKRGPT
jgi:hypothetical protein